MNKSSPLPASEPQLIKAQANDPPSRATEPPVAAPSVAPPPPQPRREPVTASAERPNGSHEGDAANLFLRNTSAQRPSVATDGNVTAVPRPVVAPAAGGDTRQKLHLSLGGSNGNGNGHLAASPGNGERPNYPQPAQRQPQFADAGERMAAPPFPPPPRNPAPFDQHRNARDLFGASDGRPAAQAPREDAARRGDNGAFIDKDLRTRVDGDIAAFLAAFDAALAEDTHESRFGLREATDRLLRAGARTRIELERLEARVPLGPRDGGAQIDPGAWRHHR